MHRGPPNSDYHRTPLPLSTYGHPPGGRPFSDPFNRTPFPPPYRGSIGPHSFSSSLPVHPPATHLQAPPYASQGPSADSFGTMPNRDPFYEVAPPKQFQPSQPPQGWSAQQTDLQSLEVRKKAEEFLRILEAQDKLELSTEKCTRTEGDEVGDPGSSTRSKSQARSRARSKSRPRSRSRSRSRPRSRGKSRPRSRGRSRSHSKSRPRAKSRVRSRSRSHSRTMVRSKSQPRLETRKDSHWSAKESSHGGASMSGRGSPPDLFQSLKQILQSKEVEKHLSVVKSALLRNQILDEVRVKQESRPVARSFQKLSELQQKLWESKSPPDFAKSTLLPHERVGDGAHSFPRILSWDDPSQQPEVKAIFPSIEDEEEFLYGEEEEGRTKPQAVTVPLAQTRPAHSPVESLLSLAGSPYLSKTALNQGTVTHEPLATLSRQPSTPDTTKVTVEECEKVKSLLKTIGLNLGMADISKMAAKMKRKQAEQKEAPAIPGQLIHRPALEVLQTLAKAPKCEDSQSNRSESSHSHRDTDRKEKRSNERERREKQIQVKRKEYLVKELEGLLKQEGSGDLIPVIGFFCQRCEEFFADLSSAEGHGACHGRATMQKATPDPLPQHKDSRPYTEPRERPPVRDGRPTQAHSHREHGERSPDRKRPNDERSPPSTSSRGAEGKDAGGNQSCGGRKEGGGESAKSEKKKKKKEKKMKKKKEKKKKKKKVEKGTGD